MTTSTAAEGTALDRAMALAAASGVDRGPNPAVGCVLLGPDGVVLAVGFHCGPGTPHAEVVALAAAGEAARGATAVVTLEPCAHHGLTPPCADALIEAGISRVVYGTPDPNPVAAGGAQVLRAAGIDVDGPVRGAECRALNPIWSRAAALGRPVVTWKVGASLDGRIAAADGTSKWITSEESRAQVHRMRGAVDAVLTGTGTALTDRPLLTSRPGGVVAERQPIRAVMGLTELPADHPLADALALRTRDPGEGLALLWDAGARHVMLECGPRLAAAFLAEELVDRIAWFGAPILLGSFGEPAFDGGPATLADAARWRVAGCTALGPDVWIELEREV